MVTEQKYPLDQTYMNVIQFGTGPRNLVIISGISLCGLEGSGEAVAKAYDILSEEYTVYLFDRKKVLPLNYQVSDMAEDIYKILTQLNVRKADVYGISQGGMMAQYLAATYPEFVNSLIICSSISHASECIKKIGKEWLALAAKKDVLGLNRSFFEFVYSENFRDEYYDALSQAETVGTPEDCERFEILVKACLSFDIRESLNQIQCPALIFGDLNDQVVGVDGIIELAETLDCPFYLYEHFSHAVYDEAPDIKERLYDYLKTT